MSSKNFFRKARYYFQYFPFTINTFLCAVVAFFAYRLLYKPIPKKTEDPSPFLPFILLMAKLAFWFAVGLVAVSVASTLLSWFHYLWIRKKKNTLLKVQFTTETRDNGKSRLFLNAQLDGATRPLLGFVKGRLFYDNYDATDLFSLLSNKRKEKSIWRAAITGKSRLLLPDIKEYELKGGFVFFQDMLHLFSLAVFQPVAGQFYQPPVLKEEDDADVYPKKTENMDVRIEQLRRVEGEYLNYKDFESGDDVRRIVWKVYAKNRDLVVRIPELYEPYASHLYFYASFYAEVNAQWLAEGYLKEMLNYYKNHVWTVLDTLSKKEWEMRYVPDQQFNVPEPASVTEKNARVISNSQWQKDWALNEYFNPKKGAVLCISSFTDPHDLKNLLERCDASTVIYFIKCSQVFRHFAAWSLLKRLVFLPPQDRLNKLRTRWVFSPMRFQIAKREKEIEELLKKSNVVSGIF
jgi:hypothetical protein